MHVRSIMYFFNHTYFEEAEQLQQMDVTSTATQTEPVIANHVHINGKC